MFVELCMAHKVFTVVPEGLELGPVVPGMSGAQSDFLNTGSVTLQTPWMEVAQVVSREGGKDTLFLKMDSATEEWVRMVESRTVSLLSEDARERWTSVIYGPCWKFNIAPSVSRFGDALTQGSLVAVAFQLVGVWYWSECCGLKTKVLQLKNLNNKENGS